MNKDTVLRAASLLKRQAHLNDWAEKLARWTGPCVRFSGVWVQADFDGEGGIGEESAFRISKNAVLTMIDEELDEIEMELDRLGVKTA